MKRSFVKILLSVCSLVIIYLIFIMDHPYFKYTHLEDGNRNTTVLTPIESDPSLVNEEPITSDTIGALIIDENKLTDSSQLEQGSKVQTSNLASDNTTVETILPTKDKSFTIQTIDAKIETRIMGISYKENDNISLDDLRYIQVLHYDFNLDEQVGELIVHSSIASDIIDIFYELYEAKYPIEKMILVDEYGGDDTLSMEDNNTSAFNYRPMVGSNTLSKHSRGLAIDINPRYNPYVKQKNGVVTILPDNAKDYIIRDDSNPYYILENDILYQAFISRGFTWGGSWNSLKDYQHFEK